MWVARELLRFAGRIAVAVVVAVVVAEIRALVSGGDTLRTFRIVLMVLGVLYLLLAAGPGASLDGRRVNGLGWWTTESRGFAALQAAPGPRLTATAVFVASGLLLLVVGVVL
jgi:hypothetical protein